MRASLFSLIALAFMSLPLFSYAQSDASSTASSTESGGFFQTIVENVTGIKDIVVEETTSKSVLDAATEKRLTNLAANISNRLDGLNMRMRHIADRVGERIDTQAADGYDVTAARASLQKAYEHLDVASSKLKNIDRDVYSAFRSQNPKAEWREVRSTYIAARDSIKAAHAELKQTVTFLKSAAPAAPVATSTASSTQ